MLHAGENVIGLRQIGLAQLRGPIKFLIHHFDNVGIAGQCLDAFVPGLLVDQRGIFFRQEKAIGHHDVLRDGRGGENLRE
jgi:hypothetical protein